MAAGEVLEGENAGCAALRVCSGTKEEGGPTTGKEPDSPYCSTAQLIKDDSQASELSAATSSEEEGGALSARRVRTASVLAP